MLAPPELMEEITDTLRPPAPMPNDSRKAQRTKVRQAVMLITREVGDIAAVHVQVRDVSQGGVGLLRARPMNLDEPFIAALPKRDGTTVYMLCSVVYYEPISEGLFSIGGRFIRMLSEPEVRSARVTLNQAALGMDEPFGEEYPTRAAS